MSSGTGTGTAKGFTPATPEQVKHLLETHLRIFIDETKDDGLHQLWPQVR